MVKLSCPNNWIVLQTRLAGPRVLKRKLLVLCFIFWIWEQIFGNCKFSDRLNIYIYKYKYIYIYCISDIYIYQKDLQTNNQGSIWSKLATISSYVGIVGGRGGGFGAGAGFAAGSGAGFAAGLGLDLAAVFFTLLVFGVATSPRSADDCDRLTAVRRGRFGCCTFPNSVAFSMFL